MTTMTRCLAPVVMIAALACGRTPEPAARPDEREPAAMTTGAVPDRNSVHISDEMLRDLRVTTMPVEEHRGAEAASMLGELGVNENRYAEVGVPIDARVTRLDAVEGQRVRVGQRLAMVQSGELSRFRGDVASATARLDLARKAYDRRRRLNEERIAPLREVQEAERELQSAEAELGSAMATLRALGIGDEPTTGDASLTLTSPIDGVVMDRSLVLGAMAGPERPAFRIADLSTLWLTVHAFERDAVRLRTGDPARISFAALPGRAFEGPITLIGRAVDPQSRTVPVRIDLANPDGVLRPGMSATALLQVGDATGVMLTVRASALQRVRDRWCVFLPKDPTTFEIRPVGRGRDLAGEVEIVSGLRAGETVVVDGAFLLKAEAEKSVGEHEEH